MDLAGRLRERALLTPDRRAFTFLAEGEQEQDHTTYAELDRRARAIAAALSGRCARGDRALLLCPPGLDFIAAFFGCLYAGVVAVPAYPPRSPRAMPRLRAILADSAPAVALAPAALAARIRGWFAREPDLPAVPWLATDEVPLEQAETWRDPGVRGDELAFLQYTSGSTSTPKGVMVSHANLAHNQRVIERACRHDEGSVFVSWLPVYHDLGLIGQVLQGVWVGAPCVLMAPVAFLQNPLRWLEAVSRYRATTSGGPNFAYELCVRRIRPEDRERLDLSSWQVAFNGAEPVRAETLDKFAAAFAPAGFRRAALYPCYGLAEATLMVAGGDGGAAGGEEPRMVRDPGSGRPQVGCGKALSDLEVVIADPVSAVPCPPGGVGEIWVAGASVARGYWNRPGETEETFGAHLADGRGPFLRTGDLGFLDPRDGAELVVTGRIKDLIILRGRNLYPQDVELAAEQSHPALRPAGGAAFAVLAQNTADGEERLVVVHEVERHGADRDGAVEEIAAAVRRAVAEELEAAVHEVVLVTAGGVPRTTSGKVQRRACRDLYLRDELPVVGRSALAAAEEEPLAELAEIAAGGALREALAAAPAAERPAKVESWLRHTFARLARLDPRRVDPEAPLAAQGLDSLVAVELRNAVEAETGAELSLADLLEGISLRGAGAAVLAGVLAFEESDGSVGSDRSVGSEASAGLAPLSWGQRSLWFLHRFAPGSAAYNIVGAARVEGVTAETLRGALAALVVRHPALRTTYSDGPDGPVQRVRESAGEVTVEIEAAGWSETEVLSRLHEEAFRPFDLARGPVFRAALLRRGDETWLAVAVHHIAADFWSLAVMARELGALCSGIALPPVEASYNDFVGWQAERLAGPRGERLWEYWQARLSGAPPLDLPSDRPRPAVQSFRGATRLACLAAADLQAIQALAARSGATLFMTLLAGFQALLGRYGGQEDFLVGSPTAGRGAERWSGVVGYFVDPVPLRADLSGDPAGSELLARVRRTALDAYAHEGFPFALLAERLQPERDPSRPALVQAMLGLEKAPVPELAALTAFALGQGGARLGLGGLTLESVPLASPAAQVDLTLLAGELGAADGGETGLALSLQASADLFDAATAERMLGHLGNLLRALAAAPERRISELPILSTAERDQLRAWSGTAPDYPRDRPVHELFAEVARRVPQRVAIAADDHDITYAELDARANQLARHLRSLGVTPEAPVGILLERSPEMVLSFLAVMKAGGAYVPLDPSHPRERLATMTGEIGVRIAVTEGRLLGGLPEIETAVLLDRDAAAIAQWSAADPEWPSLGGRGLVYVMFTSGSTGRPKAVGAEHRGVVRLVRESDFADLGEDHVYIQIAPNAFDAATLEIWAPLLNGGRLALYPGRVPSLAELAAEVARRGVTTLWLTTGLFHQVVESRIEMLRGLRQVLFGGDVLSPELLNRAVAELPGCRLVHAYGPTENTTFTTCGTIGGPVPQGLTVGIGRPIANSRVHLVDRHFQPVPVGVPGELLCGGEGLARGYLRRPELTAEKFVPDPFAVEPGERLYRSGDLVRWRPDGELEFIGRIDQQVKIRGFRVEPGEVETALSAHPEVSASAVVVAGRGAGGKRLVAYVVAQGEEEGDGDAAGLPGRLRAFLRERLPEPMLPAAFLLVPALPLNANGKIDRRALPDPETAMPVAEEPSAPPRTPVEEVIAGIWAEVLGVGAGGRVGIHDDFFTRGGHSLLATQVIARLREPFGVEPPLAAFFADPTVAGLAAVVERARTGVSGERGEPEPALVRVPRDGRPLPLSFAQERLWFLDRLLPGLPVYNVPAVLRLRGALDEAALAAALCAIVRRHEALRTAFSEGPDGPVQRVLPAAPLPLPMVDLSAAGAVELYAAVAAEARAPFDLAAGPLLRARLLRLAAEDHILVLTLHHIASDGWSLDILLRELEALYGGGGGGELPRLPELPVQYPDYAVWQRERLTAEALAVPLAGWREALAGAPDALDLSTDRPRPPVQAFHGAVVPFALDAAVAEELRGLARREGATLAMTLLAGFATLLGRHAAQEDVVIGSPVANRGRTEIEGLIGFFVNTLPLRVRLDGEPSFRAVVGRAREASLTAWTGQEVPFERLVEELQPRRDMSRSPLFQAMLAFQEAPARAPRLPGIAAEAAAVHTGTAKFELTLYVQPAEGGSLTGELEIETDLFDTATGGRLLARFATLLAAAADDAGTPAFELPLLPAAEARQLLDAGDAAAFPFDREVGLHELFAAQAARTPGATALVWGEERITYRELDRRVDRLARRLHALGVGPEVRVGVFSGRTPALIAALLGAMKAGGAYVPLDPAYPAERLAFLLADSGAPVVLAEEGLLPALPPYAGRVVALGEALDGAADGAMDGETGALPRGFLHPDQLAYAIYTSGSTGVPKGVGIRHAGAVAMVAWALATYPRARLAGVLAATSVCFDLSVFEIFVPLAAGGAVILADDALALPELPAAGEVTLVNTVPSAMAALARAGALPAAVRVVNLAGEPLRRELTARIYDLPGVEEVWNLYGPSEDTTYSTGVLVPRADAAEPTIGRPLSGGRARVLDPRGQPAPQGVPGELWLGGEGLARGYLGRPELTADRFRPDPSGGAPGARLYRTGDLARVRPDGEIDFLGRIDHQVKVRGFRVEPGEIEAALGRHPEVAEAVVVARRDPEGGSYLVAYAAPIEPGADLGPALRKWLRERLPEPFVPGVWVMLDALPRTPNGKVDRKALPTAVAPPAHRAHAASATPRTPAEELLAGIFAEVLGVESVGPEDDFFALGGHSLLAARVAARLREPFGVELPLRVLFEAPTVAALAARIQAAAPATPATAAATTVPLVPVAREQYLPLSFAQERLWFLDRLTPGLPVYNVPAALCLTGILDVAALEAALGEIARRHEALRTVFASHDGRPVQIVRPPAPWPLPLVDLSAVQANEDEAARLAAEEAARPFDLAAGPSARALLLRLGPAEHRLVLVLHHIACDGGSLAILFNDLAALYTAFAAREASPLPELPLQYADWAFWQRARFADGGLEEQIDWWRERLAGAPEAIDLPADLPRPPAQTWRGGAVPLDLPAELARDLRALARREGSTLFMTLLAGFAALLRHHGAADDLVIGSAVADRRRAETEGLIGFFVNTLPLRVELGPEATFRDLLAAVREAALGAWVHQDVPFERLVQELLPRRDPSRAPLFQVSFAFQETPPRAPRLPGLETALEPLHMGTAKLDLSLGLEGVDGPAGGLTGGLEYNADLFEAATARRLLGRLPALLAGAAAAPARRVLEIPVLTAAEREELIAAGIAPAAPDALQEAAATLPALFAAQAARTPGAVAVEGEEAHLTYAELAARAGRLARHLRRQGIGPESIVGLAVPRSPEMVAAMLGILESGAAYLPLDPDYPAERLAAMVEDARPAAVVTVRVLAAVEDEKDSRDSKDEHGDGGALPDNLAYVMYTSGSTGRPKGVAAPHRGLVNRLLRAQEAFALTPDDAVLHKAPVGFDFSVWEIFAPLLVGARVVLARPGGHRDPAYLARTIAARGVTLVHFVPSLLEVFLGEAAGMELGSLRRVFVGGEALSPELRDRFFDLFGPFDIPLENQYGPTEASIDLVWHTSRPGAPAPGEPAPIGRPIAGCAAHVLSPAFEPAPAGVPGELWLGGVCLARGYFGRPDLTAERFAPDPFARPGEEGGRLYRTGDLVRRRADGEIEYLGRIDQQVKIRGVRIEPAEIEAALLRQPGIREAAVILQAEGAGSSGPRLAAFFVAAEPAPDPQSLRQALAASLPTAMLPAAFTALPEMPRTPSGKLDRRALARRTPAAESPAAAPAGRAPRTPTEELTADLWAGLLRRERVGVDDDFFDLGGHSLLGAQLLDRLRAAFGVELPLRALFEAPTVAGLATRLDAARAEGTAAGAPPLVPLSAAERAAGPPLSFAQERLWLVDRLAPELPTYNIPAGLRLRGPLGGSEAGTVAALAAALGESVRRHEVLRTVFTEVDGAPVASVLPAAPVPVQEIDLTGFPDAEGEALHLAALEARRPFDLARGPLLRALLLRLGEADGLLVLTVHHIAADGWSMDVLFAELAALCGAVPLPELPVQYTDWAAWQRRWLAGGALEAQLAGWRERLAGVPDALELPLDRPRPPAQAHRGAAIRFALPAGPARALRTLARREGATLYMVLLAAFGSLLARTARQDDLVIGTPVANRGRAEVEGLIGFFVNTLPLRLRLDGDPSFAVLAGRAREAVLAAWAGQEVPFERLVEELQPRRDLSRSPLFQVMLTWQEPRAEAPLLPGIAAAAVALHTGTAKFELTLALAPAADGGLTGGLEFDTDLFDPATADRFLARFATLLAAAAAAPEGRALELPLLPEAEARQILEEWNAPPLVSPDLADIGLHELFAAQAARTPGATALVWGDERITYRELARRADRLARRLGALGVGPEARVGVFASRTPDLIAALLGILTAGGAYIPLDPAYPAERLAVLLADSGAPVVLAEERLLSALPPYGGRVLPLGAALAAAEDENKDGDESASPRPGRGWVHPDQLAYAIYTSGSTGVPKGVGIRHAGAVAMVSWALAAYPPERLAGVLAATSICFDLSVFEIFVPLAAGGAVILADDALALPGLPAAGEVTLINTVPSAMAALARAGAVPAAVRVVNLAGEPLRRELADRLYALPGVEEVWNLYGPSEDTTYSTGVLVPSVESGEPTVGRPLPGGRAYILDPGQQPAPLGVPGELWLGGEGLARGYLGRPELTADRFRPDPFGGVPGARLYRTGDLTRLRPDGEIEFLGRLDHQVKVRGFRVEPGEIEVALGHHPAVAEAVVAARTDTEGNTFLAAWVALAGPASGTGDPVPALRAWLRERLPEPFVPGAWTILEALPRTPNGKVDRKALPAGAPAGGAAAPAGQGAAPRTPVEELVAGLFAEALGVEAVGADDDFFALGGHSLLAARVAARLREPFGVELPLRVLFEAPTVAGLAARVEAARGASGSESTAPPLVPLGPAARAAGLPLSFSQERLWFLDQMEPGSAAYNIAAAVALSGALDPAALAAAFTEVARRHESLRTVFTLAAGAPRQRVSPPAPVDLPLADLADLPAAARAAEAARLAAAEAARPFDLAHGPLLRTTLLRLAAEEHAALVTMHHICSDGWSTGVLVRELGALYGAFAAGRPSPLPLPPVQYPDFAVWQREWLRGPVLAGAIDWWREQLAGAPESLELPADRPRPAVQSYRGRQLPFRLDGEAARALRTLSRRHGATLFMTLLAGFQALLARCTRQGDLLVGAPVANRERPEVEGLIGFFVNTLVLRTRLGDDPAFAALLARVRATALGAYDHAHVPFEKLVEELRPGRSLSRTPLFQVALALQNAPDEPLALPGLLLAPVEPESATAKFDLTVILRERPDSFSGFDGIKGFDGIDGILEYATDLFDGATIERLAGHLATLLAGAAARPGDRLSELPLLTAGEERQLLGWSRPDAPDYPRESTVHALVEAQARRTPAAPAVEYGGVLLTYGELESRANRLAHHLRRLGVGAEARVGLAVERSADMVVGMLGILKAGAAYVPLDLNYPPERLALMAADSGLAALVARESWGAGLPEVLLDRDRATIEAESAESPGGAGWGGWADSLAYVMYTSGSTGRPKGVAIPHRGIVRLILETDYVQIEPADRIAQVSNTSFDAATLEIWGALMTGACAVGLEREVTLSPEGLEEAIAGRGVTLMFLTTALFNQVARQRPGTFRPMRYLFFGGEACDPNAVRAVLQSGPPERLVHCYGPTESTTFSVCQRVEAVADGAASVPIGGVISHTEGYVVDPDFRMVPAGVPGELLLGGDGLARGYWGRPDLTAERFVPSPWSGRPGERVYRSGDLVRWTAAGPLEFVARIDQQVKIRGFRVEPGEIEAALCAHAAVRAAAVMAREDQPGNRRLVAYVVPEAAAAPEPAGLRAFLRESLPEYMVPAAFAFLAELPLTPNGKVDHRALPAPDGASSSEAYTAPRNAVEELLAAVWSEVLGNERIGVHDDFFDLGGHSLLAVRLVSRIRDDFGIEIQVKTIFDAPTVAELAELLAQELARQVGEGDLEQLFAEAREEPLV